MLNLSAVAKMEKNKIASTGVWLILLEIIIDESHTIRICNNNEDISWNGLTWNTFPFQLSDLTEDSKGQLPQITLKVSNVTRTVEYYLEEVNGGTDSQVILRVVHSGHLDLLSPELEEIFVIKNISADAWWVSFKLGPDYTITTRYPLDRYNHDFCQCHKVGGVECGYAGSETECNRTLARCRELNNSIRFGGEPSLPGGLYAG